MGIPQAQGADCSVLKNQVLENACGASCGVLPDRQICVPGNCSHGWCCENPRNACEKAKRDAIHVADEIANAAQQAKQEAERLAREVAQQLAKETDAAAKRLQMIMAGAANTFCQATAAKQVLEGVPGFSEKLAQARRLRAGSPPIDTGFDPAAAQSPAGKLALYTKANQWERSTLDRHFRDLLIVPGLEIEPSPPFAVVSVWSGMQNSGWNTGTYLAARAFKYQANGADADLAPLYDALAGVSNLMTIANAPAGTIKALFGAKKGTAIPGERGIIVRGYAVVGGPNGTADFSSVPPAPPLEFSYEYDGRLEGGSSRELTGKIRFLSNVSRDEVYGLLFGLGASYEVLMDRQPKSPWIARIRHLVEGFAVRYVRAGLKLTDFGGRVTSIGDAPEGDQSQMSDPRQIFQNLSWLKTAAYITGNQEVEAKYKEIAQQKLGVQRAVATLPPLCASTESAVSPSALGGLKELVLYFDQPFNWNYWFIAAYSLLRWEKDNALHAVYQQYATEVLWPLYGDARVPLFDYIHLLAKGEKPGRPSQAGQAIIARAAGALRQYRDDAFPFGRNPYPAATGSTNDFSARADLRDPLSAFLRDHRAQAPWLPSDPCKGGLYALGPGLIPRSNNIMEAYPYALCMGDPGVNGPYGSMNAKHERRLIAWSGHDYLLNYWFGRALGFVNAPDLRVDKSINASQSQRRGLERTR